MTDEIATHVLAHNYDQTLALTLLEAGAAQDLDAQARFMADLEAKGRLDRALEGLPNVATIAARAAAGKGLTRPELAVLLAYGKLTCSTISSPGRRRTIRISRRRWKPTSPRRSPASATEMKHHRLRREIIATVIDNDMVNLCGPSFPSRMRAATGCDATALVTGFEAARQVLRFSDLWSRVETLDSQAPAVAQTALYRELVHVLRGLTFWLTRRAGQSGGGVEGLIMAYRPAAGRHQGAGAGGVVSVRAEGRRPSRQGLDQAGSAQGYRPLGRPGASAGACRRSCRPGNRQAWPIEHAAFVFNRVGGAASGSIACARPRRRDLRPIPMNARQSAG